MPPMPKRKMRNSSIAYLSFDMAHTRAAAPKNMAAAIAAADQSQFISSSPPIVHIADAPL